MRRVLETLTWEEEEWKRQAGLRTDATRDLAEGIRALSSTQASIKNTLRSHFQNLWKSPLEESADSEAQPPGKSDANNNDEDEDDEDGEGDGFGVPSSSTRVDEDEDMDGC